jgi:autotransporter passenger strand-loop-strand repeat protein
VSTTALAGGNEYVTSGATASATTVSSGGQLYVSSGGIAIGTTVSGGTEVMAAGAVGSGTFDFAGNGDLVIDQTSGSFGASISGLTNSGQILDFANIASSGASVSYSNSGTSGTLTVTNGTNSVSVNLIGTYSAGSFKSANDGSGGIEVYDPPQVPNGGVVTSSSADNLTPTSGGSTMAGGLNLTAHEFNHMLFANYAAALSDERAFGSSTPVLGNNANPLTSAGILTSPIFNQHRH